MIIKINVSHVPILMKLRGVFVQKNVAITISIINLKPSPHVKKNKQNGFKADLAIIDEAKNMHIKMANGSLFEIINNPGIKSLSPISQLPLVNALIKQCQNNYYSQREQQIIDRLYEFGYSIQSKAELFKFLSERCHIEERPNNLYKLFLHDKLICEWYDTFEIENDFDPENKSFKSTITYGKPPKF